MKHLSRGKKTAFIVILAVALLVFDQVTKVLVKTGMHIGESIPVFGEWFQILFIENEGMAFGMAFGGEVGKYVLTSLRIVLSVGLTAIMVGAIGNVVDCMFYGLIFEPSTYTHVASAVPFGEGYGTFGLGKVVDMLYFPIINTTWPDWVPGKGGEPLIFFRPIFNVADSCITVGALYLLIFKWKYFQVHELSK